MQGQFGILAEHLQLGGALGWVRPINVSLAILFQVSGHQTLRLRRQPTGLAWHRIAQLLQ